MRLALWEYATWWEYVTWKREDTTSNGHMLLQISPQKWSNATSWSNETCHEIFHIFVYRWKTSDSIVVTMIIIIWRTRDVPYVYGRIVNRERHVAVYVWSWNKLDELFAHACNLRDGVYLLQYVISRAHFTSLGSAFLWNQCLSINQKLCET